MFRILSFEDWMDVNEDWIHDAEYEAYMNSGAHYELDSNREQISEAFFEASYDEYVQGMKEQQYGL